MIFNFGLLLVAIPVIAFATGTATEVNDGAFYIVLTLMAAGGAFSLHAAVLSSDSQFSKSGLVYALADIWAFLAFLTLSVPITLAIKWWRSRRPSGPQPINPPTLRDESAQRRSDPLR
ncbi:MAG: hypothetical protein Q8K23_05930 [Sulfuritalea sp.]|nr:hypothetical protein [Sulfuritalea sp.]